MSLAIRRGYRQRRQAGQALLYLVLILALVAYVLPILWMISMSLKEPKETIVVPPHWIPSVFRWANYLDIWTRGALVLGVRNSSVLTVGSMIGVFVSAPLVAFGFARLRFAGRDALFVVVLATMMLPGEVTLIPLYIIYKYMGWLDTYLPFIVPAFLGGGAFFIFLLRQFFMTIPVELEDAARMDGCGTLRMFLSIFLPLAKPALATVGIFAFVGSWNNYLGPLLFLSSKEKMPLPVALQMFRDVEGGIQLNLVMAGAMAAVVPCLIIFFVFQEYMVGGIALTGIKG